MEDATDSGTNRPDYCFRVPWSQAHTAFTLAAGPGRTFPQRIIDVAGLQIL
jgi:hypothetical protein